MAEEIKEKSIVKGLAKAIRKYVRLYSWDLRKVVVAKKDGCSLELDVIHKGELPFDEIETRIKAIKNAFESMESLGYSVNKKDHSINFPNVDGKVLYNELLKTCKSEHKRVWDEPGTAYDFSLELIGG